jgi:hypothetical protein
VVAAAEQILNSPNATADQKQRAAAALDQILNVANADVAGTLDAKFPSENSIAAIADRDGAGKPIIFADDKGRTIYQVNGRWVDDADRPFVSDEELVDSLLKKAPSE